jgi:hypothetical protein
MSRRLAISDLLNPESTWTPGTIFPRQSQGRSVTPSALPRPSHHSLIQSPQISSLPQSLLVSTPTSVEYGVYFNRQTTLVKLYRYPMGTYLEYPECSELGPIGHLFEMDPDNWSNPALNIVYSRGAPSGRSKGTVLCPLLVDREGVQVLCSERHTTCM